jgi:hypothetical protein
MQRCKLKTQKTLIGQKPFFEDQWNQWLCQLYLGMNGRGPGQSYGVDHDEIAGVQVELGD